MKRLLALCLAVCLVLTGSLTGAMADDARYTISIASWDAGAWGNDALATYLGDRFNIDLEFIGLSTVDFAEKINIMAIGETLPDIFMYTGYSGNQATVIKWAEDEVVKALPDDLSAYPNLKALMDRYDFMKIDGKHYFIPRTTFSNPDNTYYTPALWVRRDWMTNLGVTEAPDTLEGFYDLMYRFTYDDPDGNGKQDTFGVTPGIGLEWVFSAFGIDINGYILEDGRYIPGMLSKRVPEVISFIQRMYRDGLIDPDFATISLADSENNFAAGRCGVCYLVGEASPFQYVTLSKLAAVKSDFNAETDLDVLPPPHAEGCEYLCQQNYNFFTGMMFSADMSDEKLLRCLELYDFLLSEEGVEFGRYGVEGISFEWVDGQRQSLVTNDFLRSLADVQPTYQIARIASWDTDGAWENPEIEPVFSALAQKVQRLYGPCMNEWKPEIDFKIVPAKEKYSVKDFFWSSLNKMVLNGVEDVGAAWEPVRQNMLTKRGAQKLIDEINAQ